MASDSLVRISSDRVAKVAELKGHLGLKTNKQALEWIVDNAALLAKQGSLSPSGSDVLGIVSAVAKTSASNARGVEDLRNALLIIGAVLASVVPAEKWPLTPAEAIKLVPKILIDALSGE